MFFSHSLIKPIQYEGLDGMEHGFTLSELIISMAVLGLISALCLPQVFNEVESIKKEAVLKESIALLNSIIVTESQKDEPAANSQELFTKNANITECRWDLDVINPNDGTDTNGCRLLTGAWVLDVNGHEQFDSVQLDWNGMAPPNELGKDRLAVAFNWSEQDYDDPTWSNENSGFMGSTQLRSGEIKPASMHRDWYERLLR